MFLTLFMEISYGAERLEPSIVGTYLKSDLTHLACRLTIHDDGKFEEECATSGSQSKTGEFFLDDDMLTLDYPDIRKELHVIRWGSLTYLLESSKVVNFCNSVNSGSNPGLTGVAYRRMQLEPNQHGILAEEITQCLFKSDAIFNVKDVLGNGDVLIDAGLADRIQLGLRLYRSGSHAESASRSALVVIEARETSSVARAVNSNSTYSYQVGDLVTPTHKDF